MFIQALGGSALAIGLIGGLRDSIASLIAIFAGYWSDRIGRRKIFVVYGYSISSICKLLLAFSQKWLHVLIFSSIERTGKGLRTASRDTIIAEAIPRQKGFNFGLHRALDTAGAIIGIVLSFLFLSIFQFTFQTIVIVASLVGIVALLPLIGVTKTTTKPVERSFQIAIAKLPQKLLYFILIAGLFALANFTYMFFLIKVQAVFSGRWALLVPVFLYLVFNIFYAAWAIPLGMLTDKIGRRKVIISGYALFSLTSLGFIYARSLLSFVILFALYGIVKAMVEGNQRAFVTDLAIASQKATSLGLFHAIIGIMALSGNIIAGMLWHYVTPTAAFLWGSTISVTAVLFLLLLPKTAVRS